MVTDPATNPQTNPQTHRQDRLQYTAPQLSAQCNQVTFREPRHKMNQVSTFVLTSFRKCFVSRITMILFAYTIEIAYGLFR